ncbi:MAG: hypothetical protein WKF96_25840 [Solirubrobacteraceae bacterium]
MLVGPRRIEQDDDTREQRVRRQRAAELGDEEPPHPAGPTEARTGP